MAGEHHPDTKKDSSRKKGNGSKKKKRQRPRNSGTCFVLMPFKEPFDTYFTMIFEPAVIGVNLVPRRGDSLFRPSPIMADIWQMIQDAKVLVAEMTEKNANVFYELGLAHALGKPVILVSETIEDVPFDLQPLRVILYNKSDPAWGVKLKGNLAASLEETLQDVTQAVPPMFRKIVKSQAPEDSGLSVRLSELERRMASMSSSSPGSLFDESKPSRRSGVSWPEVARNLTNSRKMRSSSFDSRAHAVAWTIKQLRRYPVSLVRKQIQEKLGGDEAIRVFDLAINAPEFIATQPGGSMMPA